MKTSSFHYPHKIILGTIFFFLFSGLFGFWQITKHQAVLADELSDIDQLLQSLQILDQEMGAFEAQLFILNQQLDQDGDTIDNEKDNCPALSNQNQADSDQDTIGDTCDNCKAKPNASQSDRDNDKVGDACDNCPQQSNSNQQDSDNDGIGDSCDNCRLKANPDQLDQDNDGIGDSCDNCAVNSNANQQDSDNDGIGNLCDNCPIHPNSDQADENKNGTGNACDTSTPAIEPTKEIPAEVEPEVLPPVTIEPEIPIKTPVLPEIQPEETTPTSSEDTNITTENPEITETISEIPTETESTTEENKTVLEETETFLEAPVETEIIPVEPEQTTTEITGESPSLPEIKPEETTSTSPEDNNAITETPDTETPTGIEGTPEEIVTLTETTTTETFTPETSKISCNCSQAKLTLDKNERLLKESKLALQTFINRRSSAFQEREVQDALFKLLNDVINLSRQFQFSLKAYESCVQSSISLLWSDVCAGEALRTSFLIPRASAQTVPVCPNCQAISRSINLLSQEKNDLKDLATNLTQTNQDTFFGQSINSILGQRINEIEQSIQESIEQELNCRREVSRLKGENKCIEPKKKGAPPRDARCSQICGIDSYSALLEEIKNIMKALDESMKIELLPQLKEGEKNVLLESLRNFFAKSDQLLSSYKPFAEGYTERQIFTCVQNKQNAIYSGFCPEESRCSACEELTRFSQVFLSERKALQSYTSRVLQSLVYSLEELHNENSTRFSPEENERIISFFEGMIKNITPFLLERKDLRTEIENSLQICSQNTREIRNLNMCPL